MIFIYEYTWKVWVYFMWYKSETFVKFKVWKTEIENQTRRKIKCLGSDNDTEYIYSKFIGVAFDQDTLHSTQDTTIKWCSKKDEYNNS